MKDFPIAENSTVILWQDKICWDSQQVGTSWSRGVSSLKVNNKLPNKPENNKI